MHQSHRGLSEAQAEIEFLKVYHTYIHVLYTLVCFVLSLLTATVFLTTFKDEKPLEVFFSNTKNKMLKVAYIFS